MLSPHHFQQICNSSCMSKVQVLIRMESRSLITASWPTTQRKKTGSSSWRQRCQSGEGRTQQQLKQGKLAHLALSSCLSSVRFTDLRSGFVPWPQLHHGSRTMLLISVPRLRGCRLLSRKHLAPQKLQFLCLMPLCVRFLCQCREPMPLPLFIPVIR